jgi:cytochrome c5
VSLLPKPANLTAARFSDERLSSVLWNGVAGSAMPPWRQMPAEDLRALVAYVHSLRVPSAAPSTQNVDTLGEGKSLFAANCASCHGETGAGSGLAAGALAPSPTNFHFKKPTRERAWDVLENGVPGTAMPPWQSQLTADERRVGSNSCVLSMAHPRRTPDNDQSNCDRNSALMLALLLLWWR